jgi:rod shape-determining protein MreD
MSRILVCMGATLITMAIARVLPVLFGTDPWPMTPAAVVVAFAALTLAPIEAVVAAALCGFVTDALAGMPVGVSSFSMVVTLLAARLGLRFMSGARGFTAAAFAGAFGMTQAVVAMSLMAFFGQRPATMSILDIGLLGLLDTVWAIVIAPPLLAVLGRLGVERQSSLGERLAARS